MDVNIGTILANWRARAHDKPGANSDMSGDSGIAELMIRYQHADPLAAAALVNLVSPQLYRFFASQTDRAGAENMLQDVWRRIHRWRHTYRPGEPVHPWMYAIAQCVRVEHYRERRRISSPETGADALDAPSIQRDDASNCLTFQEFVAGLPNRQREAVTLLRMAGLSIPDVARSTASTEWAVRRRAHRAYRRLRDFLSVQRHCEQLSRSIK